MMVKYFFRFFSLVSSAIIICLLFVFSLDACKNVSKQNNVLDCATFSVQNFDPLNNWQFYADKEPLLNIYDPEEKLDGTGISNCKNIFIDYNNVNTGFVIPSLVQLKNGKFIFEFEIKNKSLSAQNFYYKLYYQNESYKFNEFDSLSNGEHLLASENFYGSWQNTAVTFKKITAVAADNAFHKVQDSFNIVGNPREEKRFIDNGINNRWKRNLRVGQYSFLLVVLTENDFKKIPPYIQNINLMNNGKFINPYFYFLYGEGKNLTSTIVNKSPSLLKVIAKPNLGAGIYIDDARFDGIVDKKGFCSTCGQDSNLFKNAPIQQFINYVDASTKMYNIPVIADVLKDNYSKMDYNWNKSFFSKDELIPTIIQTSKQPCQTVFSDAAEKSISLKNPAAKYGEWKKESVGIITRHGFTYGKYRLKVKLTELLNKNNVWNGLTNAIWLITQGGGEWNYRRNCDKEGYMATYWGGQKDKRVPAVDYSEIDFEILKTPPYCPDKDFPPVYKNTLDDNKNINSWNVALPDEITNNDNKVTVACTNWDMACWDPKSFGVGCNPLNYKGEAFFTHRWDHWYRALTEKTEVSDDELFAADYYYFEIDWRPSEIIWRIGPEPEKMRVVGYMNETITSIPNNQMLLIITQEFHNTKWWPGTPYSQDNIPFPANDILGKVFDLTIE